MGEKNTSMGGFWVFFIYIYLVRQVGYPLDQNHKIREPPETQKKGYPTKIIKSVNHPKLEKKIIIIIISVSIRN